jgi:hypothetical protein
VLAYVDDRLQEKVTVRRRQAEVSLYHHLGRLLVRDLMRLCDQHGWPYESMLLVKIEKKGRRR